ncbi:hypothetical protein DICVIV_02887 [Dictyocaulus viviparus]|uniref:Aftiphilin clathrin-binding box domain-containing protein n=1 Tax=Dictyocaulus viviparus TaxID=29172 RepID=A0A0D8Y8L7_DICVI|nr:hypothetical protein DICVIV_02887 [Dictyocaulus viviparus]
MDFEAPPPFVGKLDEPSDFECDARITVDDSEEFNTGHLELPTDLPCNTFQSNSPQLSSCKNSFVKRDDENDKHVNHHICHTAINGIRIAAKPCSTDGLEHSLYQEDASQVDENDEDEFGDFADFSGHNLGPPDIKETGFPMVLSGGSSEVSSSLEKIAQSDQKIRPSTCQGTGVTEEWSSFISPKESKSDSSWSADFKGCSGPFTEEVGCSSCVSHPITSDLLTSETMASLGLEELCDMLGLWHVENKFGDDEVYDVISILDSDASTIKENKDVPFFKGCELWLSLRVIEEASALKFEWRGSQHRANFYKTLGIDANTTRASSSPSAMFNILEPTPITENGATRQFAKMLCEEARNSKTVAPGVISCELQASVPSTSVEPLSIPNADFDWEKSGLTNPTTAANRSSALLDVDFLWANSSGGNASTISTLQKELDQLGLSNSKIVPENLPSMLDVVMASATKSDRKNIRPPSELSLDARALHDQLPDIDFLRSSMIMFPIGGNRSDQ